MSSFLCDVVESFGELSACHDCRSHIFGKRIAVIDVDRCPRLELFKRVKQAKYMIALTDNYEDKKNVLWLYKQGFADVRPKQHKESLIICIKAILKRKTSKA